VKIATWNVNSLRVRLEHVLAWLDREQPSVLALQETKLTDENFPREAFSECGYAPTFSGQPTYNGVAVLSKSAPTDVKTEISGFPDPERRVLAMTIDGIRLWNLYVPNGQRLDSDKFRYKLEWLAALRRDLEAELEQHGALLAVGDFNVAPEDRDVHDPAAWEGHVLCSPAERAALAEIERLGLADLFRKFEQPAGSFSWWDYRAGAFRRNQGLRIDLMLASRALGERCSACWIDVAPRRLERPSDHVPVVAEFS
jgi:exodeoxyribonuclease-3